ncbi:MAG: hypothetical protein H7A51_19090 [Akkermansiaceae bacterium]|nr:hypothetical protein [Akkermansiaceae bacterium]
MKISRISRTSYLVAIALFGPLLCSNILAQTVPRSAATQDDNTVLVDLTDGAASKTTVSKNGAAITKGSQPSEAGGVEKKTEPSDKPAGVESPAAKSGTTHKTADEGIQIHIEKSTGKSGALNQPGAVKVYSPWPAKPITPAPAGWKFAPAPTGLKPYKTTITLGSGNTVDLSITPFVLVPHSDGLNAIRIAEPGYDPALQYAQKDTVGTMLQTSTAELEDHEKQAAEAISRLQQLLSSLPQQ